MSKNWVCFFVLVDGVLGDSWSTAFATKVSWDSLQAERSCLYIVN